MCQEGGREGGRKTRGDVKVKPTSVHALLAHHSETCQSDASAAFSPPQQFLRQRLFLPECCSSCHICADNRLPTCLARPPLTRPLLILHLTPRYRTIKPSRSIADAHSSALGSEGERLPTELRNLLIHAALFHPSLGCQRLQHADDRAAFGQGAKL